MVKILSAREAIDQIQDNDHVALGGFIGSVVPEELELTLGKRYLETKHPKNLSIYFAAGQGDAVSKSVNHLSQEGLVKFVIGGHIGLIPKLQKLIHENKVQGYNLPQGVISHLFRDSAAKKPGVITKVGLKTYVDPRVEGGKLNSATKTDWVKVMKIDNEEYLFYKPIYANVALLRGTTADTMGNITMEEECLYVENLAIAQLVKNNGGKVIVQVKRVVEAGELNPQLVRIPGILVDTVVIVADESNHMETFKEQFNPTYHSSYKMLGLKMGEQVKQSNELSKLDLKKVIARRCLLELKKGGILNLGIGAPEYVAVVAEEENILQDFTLTVEPGAIGGRPAGSLSFGATSMPQALVTQDQQFDFYDGGGLDQAFLGLAEADKYGNINVSRFGPKIPGCGGFINITQNAKEVFFTGTFVAGKSDIEVKDGKLKINTDGTIQKFIDHVQQITFSGEQALISKQRVLYITERAVFKLTQAGLELIEIAPGIDLEKDILAKMSFKPIISKNLKLMDERIFQEKLMQLK